MRGKVSWGLCRSCKLSYYCAVVETGFVENVGPEAVVWFRATAVWPV